MNAKRTNRTKKVLGKKQNTPRSRIRMTSRWMKRMMMRMMMMMMMIRGD
jgi:hypothetical protein